MVWHASQEHPGESSLHSSLWLHFSLQCCLKQWCRYLYSSQVYSIIYFLGSEKWMCSNLVHILFLIMHFKMTFHPFCVAASSSQLVALFCLFLYFLLSLVSTGKHRCRDGGNLLLVSCSLRICCPAGYTVLPNHCKNLSFWNVLFLYNSICRPPVSWFPLTHQMSPRQAGPGSCGLT